MLDYIKKVPLFARLNENQQNALAQICIRRSYKGNTVLFSEKDIGNVFYMVVSGSVKIFTTGSAIRISRSMI
ncbi:cyclic nucleotide-binding domain-containing protein [Paenibacillus anseongense]|uniref:cyclic nucleotide-binding domain-containing protein n=1 Tax=Paenibacillus TaxID=44249 RepID=UPI002DB7CB06|nr:cyclic nucleotide-binding domain-containing protein [Paenibacillus anseongense]MEC0270265.1 cyclic nucleotide-binding domain-containing protein [Paenibacillus anseongense]